MSDDEPILRLDLSGSFDSPTPEDIKADADLHRAEMDFELAQPEVSVAVRVEARAVVPIVPVAVADDGFTLPDSFNRWTPDQKTRWASKLGLSSEESQWRVREVNAARGFAPVAEVIDDQASSPQASLTASGSSWNDVPLGNILDAVADGTFTLPKPTVGMLADGSAGLFYAGRVNGVAGESGAGKGWLALTVAAERMRAGGHVYYLDFEDSPAIAVLRLVSVLGVDATLVRFLFHYIRPTNHDAAEITSLVERVSLTAEAFVVIDSTGESIAAAGMNQNHDEEVARWFQDLAHPLADKGGATVLLLDHMVKSEDGGLWPIGSQRKRAAITGAQFVAEIAQPYSKTQNGLVVLKVAKDRHGAREARSIASYVQFTHPIQSTKTLPDGTLEVVYSEALTVTLGGGKTADQVAADKVTRAAAALDADVFTLDQLTPPPTNYRDVKMRLKWKDDRAQAAMREWKSRQKP